MSAGLADLIVASSAVAAIACGVISVLTRDPWWLTGMSTPFIALFACRNYITRDVR